MIQCNDDSYYVGMTGALVKRYCEHEEGSDLKCYTYSRRPFKLIYWETYESAEEAILREKQLKNWSRVKKRSLLYGDIKKLKEMSVSLKKPAISRKDLLENQ
jgi:putative endonuclease